MNSILWDNSPAQIYLRQEGAGAPCSLSISYTDFQGGVAAVDTAGTNYIQAGSGNLDSDPLFADDQAGYLFEGSPCVDAGNPDVQYEDLEDPYVSGTPLWPALGTLRNDMGAYGGQSQGIVVAVPDGDGGQLPLSFALEPNYPNPFNPQTLIRYSVPVPTHVRVTIYNILGRRVRTLVDENRTAGTHSARWDGTNAQGHRVATGVYFYRIQAGDYTETRKMLMLK
jgi:hypothetical protein